MHLPADFDAEIYDIVAQIPAGRVVTYGQLARLAGMLPAQRVCGPRPPKR